MAKARSKLAEFLGKLGSKVFRILTRWEDKGFAPRTSHWLKLGVLGFLVVLIGSLTAQTQEFHVMCYDMAIIPDAYVTHMKAEPNPTEGADSVTVTAQASVGEENPVGTCISGANIRIGEDSTSFPMFAVDGEFDEATEELIRRISLKGIQPGTTWVYVTAETSNQGSETQWFWLLVSGVEKDTIYETPEIETAPGSVD